MQTSPGPTHGDTLNLAPDSVASGLVEWDTDRVAAISRWHIRFTSKDPLADRADWREGHTDGGDVACMSAQEGCISAPVLCLGAPKQYQCQAFHYAAPDSLLLANGTKYVRVSRAPSASD